MAQRNKLKEKQVGEREKWVKMMMRMRASADNK
jgi:hypothetical protein